MRLSLRLRAAAPLALVGLLVPAATASAAPPVISAVTVAERTDEKLVVTASISSDTSDATAALEFGRSSALGGRTSPVTIPAGGGTVPVTMTISRLEPETTYHFRFTATNADGTTTSEVVTTRTAARPPVTRALPVVSLSFAMAVQRSGTTLGRLLGATRPRGLPTGTTVSIRCRSGCRGGGSFRIRSGSSSSSLAIRFRPTIRITTRSVVEIRAVRAGYLGRVQRYVFRRSGELIVPRRTYSRCLTTATPPQVRACPA